MLRKHPCKSLCVCTHPHCTPATTGPVEKTKSAPHRSGAPIYTLLGSKRNYLRFAAAFFLAGAFLAAFFTTFLTAFLAAAFLAGAFFAAFFTVFLAAAFLAGAFFATFFAAAFLAGAFLAGFLAVFFAGGTVATFLWSGIQYRTTSGRTAAILAAPVPWVWDFFTRGRVL